MFQGDDEDDFMVGSRWEKLAVELVCICFISPQI